MPPCLESSPLRLPISTPPTGLDEYFFFNTLVIRFPHTLIFWQFWLFFLFLNLLLSFFWLWEEAKYVYLCLHLGLSNDLHILTLVATFSHDAHFKNFLINVKQEGQLK